MQIQTMQEEGTDQVREIPSFEVDGLLANRHEQSLLAIGLYSELAYAQLDRRRVIALVQGGCK